MATLREIRRRITSITKISQVTDAMRMVATAKLRKAQAAIEANRPYAEKYQTVLGHLISQIGDLETVTDPLLESRETKKVCLISVSADRGLCGSFNANIIRSTNQRIRHYTRQGVDVSLICVGRRTNDFFKRQELEIIDRHTNIFNHLNFATAVEISNRFAKMFIDGEIDFVEVIYNDFKSAIKQNVLIDQLLPLTPIPPTGDDLFLDYLYEPTQIEILRTILSKHLTTQVWKILLDSSAAEHAARMTSMENATKNAKELIDTLILQRNRARQAMITKEISEIVGGAEALEG